MAPLSCATTDGIVRGVPRRRRRCKNWVAIATLANWRWRLDQGRRRDIRKRPAGQHVKVRLAQEGNVIDLIQAEPTVYLFSPRSKAKVILRLPTNRRHLAFNPPHAVYFSPI